MRRARLAAIGRDVESLAVEEGEEEEEDVWCWVEVTRLELGMLENFLGGVRKLRPMFGECGGSSDHLCDN